jgi:hypoxanthine phosphoribosyltransferase
MKLTSLKNIQLFIFIILISMYHFYIHNNLEKIFSQSYFEYDTIKRPLSKCRSSDNSSLLGCIGMPSGHAETSSVFSFLLYFYKIIPLWVCLLIICIVSTQRIISYKHTLTQVIVGATLGFIYAVIYKKFTLGFIIVLTIGLLLTFLSVYQIDRQVYGPIPSWVDKSMYESIKKKQSSPFYIKFGTIYANALVRQRTFIRWNELEKYLDKMIDKINNSEIKYDAVVGIKTGGAIISDYISLKLGLPNYKIKLTRKEYNCDKKPSDTINNIIKNNLTNVQSEYTICEGIDDNLEGKNIILVDELVQTGKTMEESYNYLKQKKYVHIIYPTCIGFNKSKYKGSLHINNILNKTVFIWPWGYDN